MFPNIKYEMGEERRKIWRFFPLKFVTVDYFFISSIIEILKHYEKVSSFRAAVADSIMHSKKDCDSMWQLSNWSSLSFLCVCPQQFFAFSFSFFFLHLLYQPKKLTSSLSFKAIHETCDDSKCCVFVCISVCWFYLFSARMRSNHITLTQ